MSRRGAGDVDPRLVEIRTKGALSFPPNPKSRFPGAPPLELPPLTCCALSFSSLERGTQGQTEPHSFSSGC